MRISHLIAAIIGATVMHIWIWSGDDFPTKEARWYLELGTGVLFGYSWEWLTRIFGSLFTRKRANQAPIHD